MKFSLPLPPSVNHLYATVRGRRVLSAEGRAYKRDVHLYIGQMALSGRPEWADDVTFTVSCHYYFKNRRRDLDGGHKILQDAIFEAWHINDRRVHEIHLYRHIDKTNPRVEVDVLPS